MQVTGNKVEQSRKTKKCINGRQEQKKRQGGTAFMMRGKLKRPVTDFKVVSDRLQRDKANVTTLSQRNCRKNVKRRHIYNNGRRLQCTNKAYTMVFKMCHDILYTTTQNMEKSCTKYKQKHMHRIT